MVQIVWTKQAFEDLKDIKDYISKESKRYAELQITKIIDRTEILIKYPYVGRIVPEIDKDNIRELIEGNYRIVYKIYKEKIFILTIYHTSRRLKIDDN